MNVVDLSWMSYDTEKLRIMLDLDIKGEKVTEISQILKVSRKKVYNPINSYNRDFNIFINGKIRMTL